MSDGGLRGADLARLFHAEVVGPWLARELPRLRYAAGRLGSGSDVLGLDDGTSRTWLDDGDTVTLRGWAGGTGDVPRIGFGEAVGTVIPARSLGLTAPCDRVQEAALSASLRKDVS